MTIIRIAVTTFSFIILSTPSLISQSEIENLETAKENLTHQIEHLTDSLATIVSEIALINAQGVNEKPQMRVASVGSISDGLWGFEPLCQIKLLYDIYSFFEFTIKLLLAT